MSLTKKAADIIDSLVSENQKLAKENTHLREQVSLLERKEKVASITKDHGFDHETAEKIASMDERQLDAVQSVVGGFAGSMPFGEVDTSKKASANGGVEAAKRDCIDFLHS